MRFIKAVLNGLVADFSSKVAEVFPTAQTDVD